MNKLTYIMIIGFTIFTGFIFTQNVSLGFEGFNSDSSSINISYNSDSDIYGFQLIIDGITIEEVNSNIGECTINANTGGVTCFDFDGVANLPLGNGVLAEIYFTPTTETELCVNDIIIGGAFGEPLEANVMDCIQITNSDWLYDSNFQFLETLVSQTSQYSDPLNLGEQVWENGYLTSFECIECGLSGTIPSIISNLENIEYLNLTDNAYSSIHSNFSNLENLTLLNVEGNNFSTIPDFIFNVISLHNLNFSRNNISSIPDNIENLTQLVEVNFSNNNLLDFSNSLLGLDSLQTIKIESNYLLSIPDSINTMESLDSLFIGGNVLFCFNGVQDTLPNWLQDVDLTIIGLDYQNCSNAGCMDNSMMNYNSSVVIDDGSCLTCVEMMGYIEIDNNCYYEIDYNVIVDIADSNGYNSPFDFGWYGWDSEYRLTSLSLGSNSLTTLPESIGNLTSLT
ncbi:MAG: leucine-rich repeat domain-containing protein, partial [Candidatus Marinimicrobia bacterium]|nr:leucine-rich repeat domain-containing protein [Candidatus Neomarinimicrobiota bacterium]